MEQRQAAGIACLSSDKYHSYHEEESFLRSWWSLS